MRRISISLVLFCSFFLFFFSFQALAREYTAYIPQVADGQGWRTQINIAALSAMEGRIDFYTTDGGEPFVADLEVSDLGQLKTNTVVFDLRQGESLIVKTAGSSDPVVVGFSKITYSASNEAAINGLFQYFEDDKMKSEAGIDASSMLSTRVVPIDVHDSLNVGVAIVAEAPGIYTVELISAANQLVAEEKVNINYHGAKYLAELFPGADLRSFQGSLVIKGPLFAATALRVSDDLSTLSSLPLEPLPPQVPPGIAAWWDGPVITVELNTHDGATLTGVEMKPPGADQWMTIYWYDPQNTFSFRHFGPGIYLLRALHLNGDAQGPWSEEVVVTVP